MKMKKLSVTILLLTMMLPMYAQSSKADKEMDRFVSDLMSQMTLDEKIVQLNLITPLSKTGPFANKNVKKKLKEGTAGNLFSLLGNPKYVHAQMVWGDSTRMRIPMLNGLDIIHGLETIFPIPLGLSCSWDMDLIERTARVAAIEGTAAGYNWVYSPMVDVTRDPRWGRVMEGAGEDPYLGSKVAQAYVRGYQGKDLSDPTSMLACVKHFAIYGVVEAGREYNTTDMSRIKMYETYLPPYKAVLEAGVGSVMSSFNDVDGVPATCNHWLLTELLRNQWGFKGFVVSDYAAVAELLNHGVAEDLKQAAERSINAGLDMDMVSEGYRAYLKELVQEGRVSEQLIDLSCRRILEAKYKMGLFRDTYRGYSPERVEQVMCTPEHLAVAREAARKSVVLVKNDNHVLPLRKDTRIALIGPFANDQKEMFSMWVFKGNLSKVVTMYEGLRRVNPNVSYAFGSQLTDDAEFTQFADMPFDSLRQQQLISEAVELAKKSDVVVLSLGENFQMSGECKSRANLSLPNCQKQLLRAVKATGKPIVLILQCGRPMTIGDDLKLVDAAMIGWRLGTEAGDALADLLFGDYSPSAKLTMTFPRNVGQIPIYYSQKNTGRPSNAYTKRSLTSFGSYYIDEQNTPLYPFGYGLSYTTFQYGSPTLAKSVIKQNETVTLTIDVTNTGQRAGDEIVQLYIRDRVASVTRPIKELKDFARITLKPGETKTVSFTITPDKLMFYNSDLMYVLEPGTFDIMVGPSSEDLQSVELKVDKQKG